MSDLLKKRKSNGEDRPSSSKKSKKAAPSVQPVEPVGSVEPDSEPTAESSVAAPKTFAELGVIDSLCEACEALGYKYATPIQEQSIPIALAGSKLNFQIQSSGIYMFWLRYWFPKYLDAV